MGIKHVKALCGIRDGRVGKRLGWKRKKEGEIVCGRKKTESQGPFPESENSIQHLTIRGGFREVHMVCRQVVLFVADRGLTLHKLGSAYRGTVSTSSVQVDEAR